MTRFEDHIHSMWESTSKVLKAKQLGDSADEVLFQLKKKSRLKFVYEICKYTYTHTQTWAK